jgi:hypothetical protein
MLQQFCMMLYVDRSVLEAKGLPAMVRRSRKTDYSSALIETFGMKAFKCLLLLKMCIQKLSFWIFPQY